MDLMPLLDAQSKAAIMAQFLWVPIIQRVKRAEDTSPLELHAACMAASLAANLADLWSAELRRSTR